MFEDEDLELWECELGYWFSFAWKEYEVRSKRKVVGKPYYNACSCPVTLSGNIYRTCTRECMHAGPCMYFSLRDNGLMYVTAWWYGPTEIKRRVSAFIRKEDWI